MHRPPPLHTACLALLLAGCVSGPRARVARAVDAADLDGALTAYDELRQLEGAERTLLGRIAGLVLVEEAHADDPARRRAAIAQLSLAGTQGQPLLDAMAVEEGVGPTRVAALVALARRGRQDAQVALRALADREDPELLAASILGMDPVIDRALLLEHARAPNADLRREAIRALAPIAADPDVRQLLAEIARVDPTASVRAAAVRSLRHAGPAAVDSLRERLSDPESSVRLAAAGALAEVDEDAARDALAPLLEIAPSPAGIEAARLLATLETPERAVSARAFLRRALFASEPALRSQAGVALTGLPRDAEAPIDAVREALAQETNAGVRLSFARALWRRDRPAAAGALEALLEGDGIPQVQAAALLASEDHERARAVLRAIIASDAASILRRTAVRALARDAMRPDATRAALRDPDALVRIYAAGGILAAAAG